MPGPKKTSNPFIDQLKKLSNIGLALQALPAQLGTTDVIGLGPVSANAPLVDLFWNPDKYPKGTTYFSPIAQTSTNQRLQQEQAGTWPQQNAQPVQTATAYPTSYSSPSALPADLGQLQNILGSPATPAQPQQVQPFGFHFQPGPAQPAQRLDAFGKAWDPSTAKRDIYGGKFIQPGQTKWERNKAGRLVKVQYGKGGQKQIIRGGKNQSARRVAQQAASYEGKRQR